MVGILAVPDNVLDIRTVCISLADTLKTCLLDGIDHSLVLKLHGHTYFFV